MSKDKLKRFKEQFLTLTKQLFATFRSNISFNAYLLYSALQTASDDVTPIQRL